MAHALSSGGRSRRVFTAGLLICLAVLGFAYYLQHGERFYPCPWCIAQRLLFISVALVCLVGLLHRPGVRGGIVYSTLGALFAAAGTAAAAYHLYLQADPIRATRCVGSPLERLLDSTAIGQLWPGFLQYDGPCTLDEWTLLGMNIPQWSLTWFAILAALFVSVLMRPREA